MTNLIDNSWFEPTPVEWNIQRMKNIMSPNKERSTSGEEELLSVTINEGIVKRSQHLNDDEGGSRADSLVGYKVVKPTNLVNNIMSMGFRCLGISKYKGIVSPAYSVFKINHSKIEPNYLNYLLRIDRYIFEFKKLSKGIQESRMRLYDNYFLAMKVIVPPLEEQKLISLYLGKKTEQINFLIEKLQKKIKLLKEQRILLINQCVTKGLDPNVAMKDSGVRWIGQIPKHWGIKKLKYLISHNIDKLSNDTDPEYQFHYIEIGDVDSIEGITINEKITFDGSPPGARIAVKPKDIIVSTVRTYLRAIAVVPDLQDVVCSTGFCVLRDKSGEIDQEFLSFSVRSEWFISETIKNSNGVTYPTINSSKLVEIKITVPPLDEQQEISSYLKKILTKLDQKTSFAEKQIELLKEYRQSLISSVVTGKVRVTEDMV